MSEREVSFSERIVRSGAIITLFTLLSTPLGYLIRVTLSRSLTIEEYGLFYSIVGFFGIFAAFNDLGFGYSVTYFIPKFLKKNDTHKIWLLYAYDQLIELTTSIILSSIIIISSRWIALTYFKIAEAQSLLWIFAFFFIFNSGFSALQKFFTGMQQSKYYSSMDFFRLIITTALTSYLWFTGQHNIIAYAWTWTIGYLFITFIYLVIFHLEYSFLVKPIKWEKQLFMQMFAYAVPTLLVSSVSLVAGYVDTFFLTLFKGVSQVGIYNVVFPIAGTSLFLFSPLLSMFLPLISQHHRENSEVVSKIIHKLLFILPISGIYICFFIFLFTESVIGMLFGNQWIASSTVPLRLLSIFYVFSLVSLFLAIVVSGMGKIKERFNAILTVFITQIAVGGVLIFFAGVMGAVLTNCLLYVLLCWRYLVLINKEVPVIIPWFSYVKTFLFLVILTVLSHYINFSPTNFFQFIGLGMIYSVIFFGGMFLLHQTEFKAMIKLFADTVGKISFLKSVAYFSNHSNG